jgi:ubiquitin-activating enzyme E1 C
MDTDDPEHIEWLYTVATARAKEFKIEGVTWSLTQGVVKNIIPAIASTNAIIAGAGSSTQNLSLNNNHPLIASCCNEAFKIATSSAAYLNNYFMLIGTDGVYSYTFEHEKRDDCPVCGGESLDISIGTEWTVDRLMEMLVEKQDMLSFFLYPKMLGLTSILAKSRSHHSQLRLGRYISKRRRSWKKLPARIWKRRFRIWLKLGGR